MANRKPSAALSNVDENFGGGPGRPQAWGGQGGTARIGHKNKMAVRDFASRLHPMADERPRITVMSARTATASRWWSAGRRARGRGARASTDGRRTRRSRNDGSSPSANRGGGREGERLTSSRAGGVSQYRLQYEYLAARRLVDCVLFGGVRGENFSDRSCACLHRLSMLEAALSLNVECVYAVLLRGGPWEDFLQKER